MAVPAGLIVAWPGTAGTIPSGWTRVTDLDGRFPKGVPDDETNPGTTGGGTSHSHGFGSHNHGSLTHTHAAVNTGGPSTTATRLSGATNYASSTHIHALSLASTNPGNSTSETGTSGTANNIPPYYDVIWIESDGSTDLPDGVIALTGEAGGLTGFEICDGSGGTPDLRGRFLRGANTAGNGGGTGGDSTHVHAINHGHTIPAHTHTGSVATTATATGVTPDIIGNNITALGHSHTGPTVASETHDLGSSGDTSAVSHLPGYRKVHFLRKDGGGDPSVGTIAAWADSLASIPNGWLLCDGDNGTPDLLDRYPYGATSDSDLGDAGGSHSHGSHTHTHPVSDDTHGLSGTTGAASNAPSEPGAGATVAAASHTHTPPGTSGASSLSNSGSSSTIDTVNSEPPNRTVAFVMYVGVPEFTDGPTLTYEAGFTGVSELASPATLTFTVEDDSTPGEDGLSWELRTATGGGGTLVDSGTATSGEPVSVDIPYDATGLVDGSQTLYLSVTGITTVEDSFTLNRQVVFTSDLEIVAGVGGWFESDLEIVAGIGGWWDSELSIIVEIPPSPLRIAYALTGRYGHVKAALRFERRTVTNQFLADVTPAFLAMRIEGNNNRTVFRTATFTIEPDAVPLIAALTDHIAVWYDLIVDGGYAYSQQWGLFALSIPKETRRPLGDGTLHRVWEVDAFDSTIHLLNSGPGDRYVFEASQNYISGTNGVASILTTLGLPHALPATTLTAPRTLSWAANATWAEVVNDLLNGINHYTIKPDAAGTFRARAAGDLANRTPDVTYDLASRFVVPPIVEERETTRVANVIVATSGTLVAVARNDDPASPTSTVTLGREITRWIEVDGAADQSTLDDTAARYLRDGSYLYRRSTLVTQVDPRRGYNEVYALSGFGDADEGKWAAQSWEWSGTARQPSPTMTHTISRVDPVAVTVS